MADVIVRMRMATTEPIEAYGGLVLSVDMMHQIAEAMKSGRLPMHFGHDYAVPIRSRVVDAGVETLDSGYQAAWADVSVDSEDWQAVDDKIKANGAPGGISISFAVPIEDQTATAESPIQIAADAAHFSSDLVLEAARGISELAEARAENYYQLSALPDAAAIIAVTLPAIQDISLNIVSSYLYDAFVHFIRPSSPTRIVLDQESDKGRLRLAVTTESKAVAKRAIDAALEIGKVGATGLYSYDEQEQALRRIDAGDPVEIDPEIAPPD